MLPYLKLIWQSASWRTYVERVGFAIEFRARQMASRVVTLIAVVLKCRGFLLVPWQNSDVDQAQERDGQRFPSVDQPLEHCRGDIGETQLSADLPFRQANRLSQIMHRPELPSLHAAAPSPRAPYGAQDVGVLGLVFALGR